MPQQSPSKTSSPPAKGAMGMVEEFLKMESAGGILLMFSAAAALIVANSALGAGYYAILGTPLTVTFAGVGVDKPLILWINDGLMAIFFFLIGLEVKREILIGQLATMRQASLPLFAAVGGMALPALTFVAINLNYPENINGWAIPAATDIAFALGILALLGNRVPVALKALLLAVAIIDDIGAIAIIAIFYSAEINVTMLGFGALALIAMVICNRAGVARTLPYVLLSGVLWYFVLKSGVHATLAGVAAALTIPLNASGEQPLARMEHALHSWVAFVVVPIFAFANAGVSFEGVTASALLSPLPLGIAMGLIIGKQVGIFGFAWIAVKSGLASLPTRTNWMHIYALSCIAGVGFTMSLFIGNLAFDNVAQIGEVKIGVLAGSFVAAILGFSLLRIFGKKDN